MKGNTTWIKLVDYEKIAEDLAASPAGRYEISSYIEANFDSVIKR